MWCGAAIPNLAWAPKVLLEALSTSSEHMAPYIKFLLTGRHSQVIENLFKNSNEYINSKINHPCLAIYVTGFGKTCIVHTQFCAFETTVNGIRL